MLARSGGQQITYQQQRRLLLDRHIFQHLPNHQIEAATDHINLAIN